MPIHSSATNLNTGEGADTFRAQCYEKLGSHNTLIRIRHAPVTYDYGHTTEQLRALGERESGRSHSSANPSRTLHTLGLTIVESGYQIDSEYTTMKHPTSGSQCARVNLTITLLSELHKVYVAKQFAPGTCGHQHILNHEQEHVRINERHLREVAERLRDYLHTNLADAPIMYPPHKVAEHQLDRWVRVRLGSWISKALDEVQYKHWNIDTPGEYEKSQYVCGGEIARLLKD